ncbi:MAG: tryptophan-rich sensory protein [Alphaproteobacteria bacterium]|nr:tryptophan-rich sensory protein [Alphaproteobacteria bacterium]
MKTFFKFVLAMVISFIPGIIGRFFTPSGGSDLWFNALNKSVLTPDGWVFGVAWTILYAILGVALFLIMQNKKSTCEKRSSYWLFAIQMGLNALWSYLFFGLQMPLLALFVLLGLIGVSVWMLVSFLRINKAAGILIIPYVLWLIFALYLNGTIFLWN